MKFLTSKKGFTLVEIIVVLVIIAILAAISLPALTGYIDDAKDKSAISEARTAYVAAQTIASELAGMGFGSDKIADYLTAGTKDLDDTVEAGVIPKSYTKTIQSLTGMKVGDVKKADNVADPYFSAITFDGATIKTFTYGTSNGEYVKFSDAGMVNSKTV